ncbi:MAG TPA: hypothetical protein VKB49_20670 [Candidatus Sulfotelmatobacter sp.]|jgi:hypothetical protein|nr:hypothetical protein [Candidatus Sulfotelmatobacter sp.]
MTIVATAITTSSAKNTEDFRRATRDIVLARFTFDFHLAAKNLTGMKGPSSADNYAQIG